mgnify:CR=1 FL=1
MGRHGIGSSPFVSNYSCSYLYQGSIPKYFMTMHEVKSFPSIGLKAGGRLRDDYFRVFCLQGQYYARPVSFALSFVPWPICSVRALGSILFVFLVSSCTFIFSALGHSFVIIIVLLMKFALKFLYLYHPIISHIWSIKLLNFQLPTVFGW